MDGRNETRRRPAGSRLPQATEAFKALGHPARLRILGMLRAGRLCVCQITAVLDLAASTVSAHLTELKRAGFVTERKDGRWIRYSLAEEPDRRPLLDRVWALTSGDPQVESDARLVRGLRRVPVEELCRVDLDVTRFGLKRPSGLVAKRGRLMDTRVSVIEILGPGCARCYETHRLVRHVVEQAGLGCQVEKNESIDRMVELGVLQTPAIAVDGRLVHQGSIPKAEEVRRLLGLG